MPPPPFPPTFDDVAKTLAPVGDPCELVSLCCYVGAGLTDATVHLYVKPYFQEWYVIATEDLVYQMPPGMLEENGRSGVWINAQAKMIKCVQARAEFLVGEDVKESGDPAGGDGSGRRSKP